MEQVLIAGIHGTAAQEKVRIRETKVYDCPPLLHKELKGLFPGRSSDEEKIAVIICAYKTEEDMATWGLDAEFERQHLTDVFIEEANKIYEFIVSKNYWCNFIDPSSGRPYKGPYTNAKLLETDSHYNHLGFHIEDDGCCKVVEHPKWGSNVFVGTIMTNMPRDSPVFNELVNSDLWRQ